MGPIGYYFPNEKSILPYFIAITLTSVPHTPFFLLDPTFNSIHNVYFFNFTYFINNNLYISSEIKTHDECKPPISGSKGVYTYRTGTFY